MTQPEGAPRDRRVFLVIGTVVLGLLLLGLVSAFVPGMDGALAAAPVVVIVLVVGTAVVLVRALRGAGR
jgi:hypothetical protein